MRLIAQTVVLGRLSLEAMIMKFSYVFWIITADRRDIESQKSDNSVILSL